MPDGCLYRVHPATRTGPADYCEADAEPGEDYCQDHLNADEPDPDEAYDDWRDSR